MVKRREAVEFLREILRECGESLAIDLVWLSKSEPEASPEDQEYQLVLKATLSRRDLDCIKLIAERFGLLMEKQEGLWIFAKDTKTSEKLAFSRNKT
jgi:hypothetical protein